MGWSSKLVQQRLREAMAVGRRPASQRTTLELLRSQEAMGWLSLVDKSERQYLAARALADDCGLSTRAMLRARRWPPTSFYRALDAAASRIAEALDGAGVAVR